MPSTSKASSVSKSTKGALSKSKKSAGNSDSKSLKLSPKPKPASSVKSSKKPESPVGAANQVLYKAEPHKQNLIFELFLDY
jgi:hypothetical protein